ncbi:MAG TPA: COQ9 family protein [Novosphingobium sp.]|nr:COQ9 family protein [Novosphingobium sp.]
MTVLSPDLTLDELRLAMAGEVAAAAVFDGWSAAAVASAADVLGVNTDIAAVAFKGEGEGEAMAMISAWIASVDAAMADRFADGSLAGLPVRERIRSLVQFRLDAIEGKEEALSIMALPRNAARSLKMGWASADAMWRLAGDVSTDYNHYTKRTILASIYAATLAVFATDRSEGKADTRAFLDRRLAGVMRFEKAKARLLGADREHFSLMRLLGRLRYPAT